MVSHGAELSAKDCTCCSSTLTSGPDSNPASPTGLAVWTRSTSQEHLPDCRKSRDRALVREDHELDPQLGRSRGRKDSRFEPVYRPGRRSGRLGLHFRVVRCNAELAEENDKSIQLRSMSEDAAQTHHLLEGSQLGHYDHGATGRRHEGNRPCRR